MRALDRHGGLTALTKPYMRTMIESSTTGHDGDGQGTAFCDSAGAGSTST